MWVARCSYSKIPDKFGLTQLSEEEQYAELLVVDLAILARLLSKSTRALLSDQ